MCISSEWLGGTPIMSAGQSVLLHEGQGIGKRRHLLCIPGGLAGRCLSTLAQGMSRQGGPRTEFPIGRVSCAKREGPVTRSRSVLREGRQRMEAQACDRSD